MAYLVDSSVFIAWERQGRDPLSFLDELSVPVAISTVTVSELLIGVYRAESASRRLRRETTVERIIQSVPIIDFDVHSARVHAEIWAQLLAAGQMIGPHDLLIAATALAYGYDVLTLNAQDFRRVPGLVVHVPATFDE